MPPLPSMVVWWVERVWYHQTVRVKVRVVDHMDKDRDRGRGRVKERKCWLIPRASTWMWAR